MKKRRDISLVGNRNVVVHGTPGPIMTEGRQREESVRYRVVNLPRTIES